MREFVLLACLMLSFSAVAVPLELDYIYPAGCRRGDGCRVTVGGNWAGSSVALGFSGAGVKAEYTGPEYVTVPVKSISKSSSRTKYVKEALPGHSRLNLTVDAQTETGIQEVFADYRYEVSNPLKFEISDYEEIVEPVTNIASPSIVRLESLPVCVNGRCYKDVADRFVFSAEGGRHYVAYVNREIIPPGGFLPWLRIADSGGGIVSNGVAVHCGDVAPALVFTAPESGEYALLVSGGGDQRWRSAVYRVLFGELPLITGFSPTMAVKGRSVNVRLEGVNLEEDRVRLFTGGKDAAMCMESIGGAAYMLPDLDFVLVDEDIAADTEPNDTLEGAQQLSVPISVGGALNPEKDKADVYAFSLAPGVRVYCDVSAPLFSGEKALRITVKDPQGKTVAPERSMPEHLRRVLPAAPISFLCGSEEGGGYTVEVSLDASVTAADGVGYRLRIGPPNPDFNVWMSPASINIPLNGSCPVDLYVHRIHGFAETVSVNVAFPPLGVLSGGGVIAGDKVSGLVTVWTDGYRYPRTPFYQELVAVSTVSGAVVSKPVRPFMLAAGSELRSHPVFTGKPPARIAYYQPGMCIDFKGKSVIDLSTAKPVEIKIFFNNNVKGSVADDYVYSVVAPEKGIVVKEVVESTADQVVRLLLEVEKDGGCKAGDSGFLVIGKGKKGAKEAATVVTQAMPFKIR